MRTCGSQRVALEFYQSRLVTGSIFSFIPMTTPGPLVSSPAGFLMADAFTGASHDTATEG